MTLCPGLPLHWQQSDNRRVFCVQCNLKSREAACPDCRRLPRDDERERCCRAGHAFPASFHSAGETFNETVSARIGIITPSTTENARRVLPPSRGKSFGMLAATCATCSQGAAPLGSGCGELNVMMLTWETLTVREAELARLRVEVEAVKDTGGPSFCANKVWYVEFKPRLGKLVGWSARKDDPVLRSPQAYEFAHHTLYRLLPDCRDCICFL